MYSVFFFLSKELFILRLTIAVGVSGSGSVQMVGVGGQLTLQVAGMEEEHTCGREAYHRQQLTHPVKTKHQSQ